MKNLQVIRINDLATFKDLKSNWEQLYKSDVNSQIFISWSWLFNYLSTTNASWLVLGVKNSITSDYVAFLPLQINLLGRFGIYPIREIVYLGKPHSVYPGFLCSTEFENVAIPMLGEYMQSNLRFDIIRLTWILDPRSDIFMDSFKIHKYSVESQSSHKALRIQLPDTYQNYLDNYFGRVSRRMIKRRTRYIQSNKNYRMDNTTAGTLDVNVDALCNLWNKRWQRKSEAEWNRNTLIEYFNMGFLRLNILWDEAKPVSALACLIDPEKKTYTAFITSYDEEYSKIAPGIVLVADSIKKAIEEKYHYYDFTVGTDAYKQLFSPNEYDTKSISIKRINLKTKIIFKLWGWFKQIF